MTTKQCSHCSHSMESEWPDQVYCIARPPFILNTSNGGYRTAFPIMMLLGKCDEFEPGETQGRGFPPEVQFTPAAKITSIKKGRIK